MSMEGCSAGVMNKNQKGPARNRIDLSTDRRDDFAI
jgi:hypothetical protein